MPTRSDGFDSRYPLHFSPRSSADPERLATNRKAAGSSPAREAIPNHAPVVELGDTAVSEAAALASIAGSTPAGGTNFPIPGSSNGRTADSGSANWGSSPWPGANQAPVVKLGDTAGSNPVARKTACRFDSDRVHQTQQGACLALFSGYSSAW